MNTRYEATLQGYSLGFNSRNIFNSKIILSIVVKNGQEIIARCLDSVFNQQGIDKLGILLLDDNSNDDWTEVVQGRLQSPALVVHRCNVGKVSVARNLAIHMAKEIFPEYEWLGRLDADDCLDNPRSIAGTLRPVLDRTSGAKWILAGNSLCEEGRDLQRINLPSNHLMTKDGLLEATLGMSQGIPEAELPSCNLWLHRDMNVTYPAVRSAEDHWLVAFLLAQYADLGILRSSTLYACYSLSGHASSKARRSGSYLASRKLLHDSVRYWLNDLTTTKLPETEVVIGWGKEGVVYRRGGEIHKEFTTEMIPADVSWLERNLKGPHFPSAEWMPMGRSWKASYPFQRVCPLHSGTANSKGLSRQLIRNFTHYCLNHNMVCLNIARHNCGLLDGNLFVFDIGRDIKPFEITYFRDMCARLYLSLICGYTDEELRKVTHSLRDDGKDFRDNDKEFKKIPGFEPFYKDVMGSWIESHGFGKTIKPAQENSLKRYNDVTLLIKACAMDSPLIEAQLGHVLTQLCCTHKYSQVLLLIDSRTQGFLREHNQGDYEKVLETGENFREQGMIDNLLVAPIPERPEYVADLYYRWFGVKSEKTHTEAGIPVFSQLWAFEQIDTRYVLQLDVDVLIGRRNFDHDYLRDMLTAIRVENIFCVGFNIAHALDSQSNTYHAPQGGYKPEVRFGMLDIQRLTAQRPFPNSVSTGFLTMTWYQSVHQYQQAHGWRSLRGGNPNTYYIHPPNSAKQDRCFMTKVMDLVEQDQLPNSQHDKWDIIENPDRWKYPPRNEDIIVLIMGRNTGMKKISRCLDSLFRQSFGDWGALIVDDASSSELQQKLRACILSSEKKSQITLVQRKRRAGKTRNEWDLLPQICHNSESLIIILDMDDCFAHEKILDRIYQQYKNGYEVILGGMFRPDKPLRRYKVRFDDLYKPDGGNAWIHLRSFRMSLFRQLKQEHLMIGEDWIEYCDDFAMMIPMTEKSHKRIMIEEYLYFHERSTPDNAHIRKKKKKETAYITSPIRRNT